MNHRILLLTLCASAAAWAQPARGLAWAWVPGGATPTVPAAYQFNSAGGTITAEITLFPGDFIITMSHSMERRLASRKRLKAG